MDHIGTSMSCCESKRRTTCFRLNIKMKNSLHITFIESTHIVLLFIFFFVMILCFGIAFGARGGLLLDNVAKVGENLVLAARLLLIVEESERFLLFGAVNLILLAERTAFMRRWREPLMTKPADSNFSI
jgi:hypothetical protein